MAHTKVMSVRIPVKRHAEILEECMDDGFTVTEWLYLRINLFERVLLSNEGLHKAMQDCKCECKVSERIKELVLRHKRSNQASNKSSNND